MMHPKTDRPNRAISTWKRPFDLAIAGALVSALLPIIGGIALALVLLGQSPFYSQQRIGRDGRVFRCWKFPSMVGDADAVLDRLIEADPAARAEWTRFHKLRNDPRITTIGRFLRRTSLDELPQLFNVLSGDMSLVGPRPVPLSERALWGSAIEVYQSVRPGLTGPWQIRYRSGHDYSVRIECLDRYLAECSPANDLRYLHLMLRVPFGMGGQ